MKQNPLDFIAIAKANGLNIDTLASASDISPERQRELNQLLKIGTALNISDPETLLDVEAFLKEPTPDEWSEFSPEMLHALMKERV